MKELVRKDYVRPEWVDHNGHFNDVMYVLAFSYALDDFIKAMGIDNTYRKNNQYTVFTLENHVTYKKEMFEGDAFTIHTHILDRDEKRVHVFFEMKKENNETTAISEQMIIGVNQKTRKSAPFPADVQANLEKLPHLSKDEWPKDAKRSIGIRRK